MFNSKINLADLKESNINQLVATEMLMIRGGHCRRRGSSSNKCGRNSYSKKRFGGKSGGCMGSITPPDSVVANPPVDVIEAA